MSFTDVINQYIKLTSGSQGGLLSVVSKLFKGGDLPAMLTNLLTNLSPDMIQKLSALRSLGKNDSTINSSDSFIHTFQQLAGQFANKETDQQIEQLADPTNASYIANAVNIAKKFGVNLDKHI